MMYEMRRRRKPEPTVLLTQEIFDLPHHIGIVWEELAFDDTVSFTQRGKIFVIVNMRLTIPRGKGSGVN